MSVDVVEGSSPVVRHMGLGFNYAIRSSHKDPCEEVVFIDSSCLLSINVLFAVLGTATILQIVLHSEGLDCLWKLL